MIADSCFCFHKCLSPKGPNCEKLDIAMPVLTSGIVLCVAPQYRGRSSVCGLLPVYGTRSCGISSLRFRSLRARPERTRNFPESQCSGHRKSCFVSMLIFRSIHTAGTGARRELTDCQVFRSVQKIARYRRSSFASFGIVTLLSDERRHSVIGDQCHPTEFSALPDASEFPKTLLLTLIVVATAESEIRVDSRFWEPEELRAWLRRSIRAFAWRSVS